MGSVPQSLPRGRPFGRYVLHDEIAAGGMATVHFGRLRGERGFARTVAIKRLQPQYAQDPDFVAMLVDEARIAARVQHPNVVPPLDVVALDERELLLVMEYVHGEVLARLLGICVHRKQPVPPEIVVAVMAGVLSGLHAAHEATSDTGQPLDIVHRDISPPNILVGVDGVARVLDFGVAKAGMRASVTRDGSTKGKLSYMSPEQLRRGEVDRRTDLFATGVVLWETLTLQRLFMGDEPAAIGRKILYGPIPPPSTLVPGLPRAFDQVVARALARPVEARFATALEFAAALERVVAPASHRQVGAWVNSVAGERLARRAAILRRIESGGGDEEPAEDPVQVLDRLTRSTPPVPPEAVASLQPVVLGARSVLRTPGRWVALALGGVALAGLLAWGSFRARLGLRAQPAPVAAAPAAPPREPSDAGRVSIVPLPSLPPAAPEAMPTPRKPARTKARAVARAPACDPPYVVDGRGIRRVNPACLP